MRILGVRGYTMTPTASAAGEAWLSSEDIKEAFLRCSIAFPPARCTTPTLTSPRSKRLILCEVR
ncbi:MAG: hypothetical protein CM15mP79_1800 [Methanobacteriota archaeon]|nr:MAG: hypothetical protein CM15mP79_1800 [Euryarchaeota archaeon]